MKALVATATAIALLGVAVAGCGGGGGSTASTSGGPGSSGGDAATAANEACAAANRKIAALGTPEDNAALIEYLERTEAAVAQLQSEVAGLDGSSEAMEYAAALSRAVGVLTEMGNAARSRNPDAVRELSKELQKLKVGELAEAAGWDTCAEAPEVES